MMKRCTKCSDYVHSVRWRENPDVCNYCGGKLERVTHIGRGLFKNRAGDIFKYSTGSTLIQVI